MNHCNSMLNQPVTQQTIPSQYNTKPHSFHLTTIPKISIPRTALNSHTHAATPPTGSHRNDFTLQRFLKNDDTWYCSNCFNWRLILWHVSQGNYYEEIWEKKVVEICSWSVVGVSGSGMGQVKASRYMWLLLPWPGDSGHNCRPSLLLSLSSPTPGLNQHYLESRPSSYLAQG